MGDPLTENLYYCVSSFVTVAIINDLESVQIDDVTIWGTPTSAHKRGEDWESIPSKVDLLLTHRPPFGILDRPRLQPREGSKRLAQAVKRIRPRVHLFGHIHHSYGTVRDQHTTFINASLYNVRKKRLVNELCVFDLP